LFWGELSGFVDEESGDIVDDGVGEPGLGAGADEGVLIEHEFGVRFGAGEELPGLFEWKRHG
jgi:hypothetical protein